MSIKLALASTGLVVALVSCGSPGAGGRKEEDTPTSGRLNVYFDEGLEPHIRNQAATFESLYPDVSLKLFASSESDAIQALYNDSCEAIVISRPLNDQEKSAFASKNYFPKFSAVAVTGIALLTSTATAVNNLDFEAAVALLGGDGTITDSTGKKVQLRALLDKNSSSVVHYLKDSVLSGKPFSANAGSLGSVEESLAFASEHPNCVAFFDFAWLSDSDDPLYKTYMSKLKFLRVNNKGSDQFDYPNQSSFKLRSYPFIRTIYVYRKTGDFTLAKGFESFVAGPKGQLIFLKQGLLPTRQPERSIHANTAPIGESSR